MQRLLFFEAGYGVQRMGQMLTSNACCFASDAKQASTTDMTRRISSWVTSCSALPSIARQKFR